MDDRSFDRLATSMAAGSRRAVLRSAVAAALAAVPARLGLGTAGASGRDDAACQGKRPWRQVSQGSCTGDKCAQDWTCVCARGADGGIRCVDRQSFNAFANTRARCRSDDDCRPGASCIDHQGCAWTGQGQLRWQRYCAADCRR